MELYLKVRQACAAGMSQCQAAKEFNISRDPLAKMMTFSVPPGYRRTAEIRRPKLEPFIPVFETKVHSLLASGLVRPALRKVFTTTEGLRVLPFLG